MLVTTSTASQGTLSGLLAASAKRVLIAVSAGCVLWLVMLPFLLTDRVLLLVMALQLGFLLSAFPIQGVRAGRKAIVAGLVIMVAAVGLGLCYDAVLRLLFGADTPTIGPWGRVRGMGPWAAGVVVALGVLIGPAGDELFFRAGLFGTWQAAGRPWSGAVLSSGLFALARLDPWNLIAYFGLGMLLCGGYRWTGSVLTPWIAQALLNAAMFVFLFYGYE